MIVQFGGRPFNTAALTLEQWMWCILFGVGVLVWGQIITTIPTKRIPKQFSWGSGPPEEMMDATSSLVEDGSSGSLSQDVKRTGQILWIRGLTRLQTQVCLIQLHNSTVSQQLSLKRQSLGSPTSPTSLSGATSSGAAAAVTAGAGASTSHVSNVGSSGGSITTPSGQGHNLGTQSQATLLARQSTLPVVAEGDGDAAGSSNTTSEASNSGAQVTNTNTTNTNHTTPMPKSRQQQALKTTNNGSSEARELANVNATSSNVSARPGSRPNTSSRKQAAPQPEVLPPVNNSERSARPDNGLVHTSNKDNEEDEHNVK